jgi:hypothetical protein
MAKRKKTLIMTFAIHTCIHTYTVQSTTNDDVLYSIQYINCSGNIPTKTNEMEYLLLPSSSNGQEELELGHLFILVDVDAQKKIGGRDGTAQVYQVPLQLLHRD